MLCKNPYATYGSLHPCGQCKPCLINRRRVWTHRVLLESFVTKPSCFLTLTYDDEHLEKLKNYSLAPHHPKLFLGRLRKELGWGSLRHLTVGEYGGRLYGSRAATRDINPHYHIALFGYDCLGKLTSPESGARCWCANCERVRLRWGYGNIVIEPLERKTAQYICGYVVKKMTRKDDVRLDGRFPEFMRPSRPGIGSGAIEHVYKSMFNPTTGEVYLSDNGDVPAQLRTMGKNMPLGRFMLSKLRDRCGVDEVRNVYAQELQIMFKAALDAEEIPSSSTLKQYAVEKFRGRTELIEAQFNLYQSKGTL